MIKLPDYFDSLVEQARPRAEKAMVKFPQPNYVLNKVAEESGEVIKAVIHYTEGRETWENVETEIIDNLAMLIRLVKEGDQVIGFTPPAEVQRLNANAQPVSDGCKVPEGWKLVPIEPTEKMLIAGFESEPDDIFSNKLDQAEHRTHLCWNAMVAAAPGGQDE
ncbi:hypothetical protein [Pantoea ananatis]|uniref:hypothetical protein n=1 Tax=Pantoea ananas TaxID=553 RepID=UPI0023AFD6DA|nr:hypothetical protein [Pantoea ananatis]